MIATGLAVLGTMLFSVLFVRDYLRPKHKAHNVLLTFIIPCYNDQETVGNTIDSIYASYPRHLITMYVIDDASTDRSYDVILHKQKQYGFFVVRHKRNQGKVRSINATIDKVQTPYFVIIDADTCISSQAVQDMLARLQHHDRVAGVSCFYRPANKGILPLMQEIEYYMFTFIQGAYNNRSGIGLRGGCMMLNTVVCKQVGKFTLSAISEDLDMAFKLNKHGYRVEQSYIGVYTHVPNTLKTWFKQKLRRNAGGFQCFVSYPRVRIKIPIHVIFVFLINGLRFFAAIRVYEHILATETVLGFFWGLMDVMTVRQSIFLLLTKYAHAIREAFSSKLRYTTLSLPYVFPYLLHQSTIPKVLLLIPFVWIYIPIFSLMGLVGFVRGAYRMYQLRDGKHRGW